MSLKFIPRTPLQTISETLDLLSLLEKLLQASQITARFRARFMDDSAGRQARRQSLSMRAKSIRHLALRAGT